MLVEPHEDIEFIVASYFQGMEILLQQTPLTPSLYATSEQLEPANGEVAHRFLEQIGARRYFEHPDLFYAMFQHGLLHHFDPRRAALRQYEKMSPEQFRNRVLSAIDLHQSSVELNQLLADNVPTYVDEDDDRLRDLASQRLRVHDLDLADSPDPIQFTKINHGYWEFLLNSFSRGLDRARFRDLSSSNHPKSWLVTGFHAALLDAFSSLARSSPTAPELSIGVSLSAGDRPFAETLATDLNPVARGALIGLLGFLQALDADGLEDFSDGSAPRNLLREERFRSFFDDRLKRFDAILVVVPPGLRTLRFPKFPGRTYYMSIPGRIAHETYRMLVPTVLGAVEHLRSIHRRLCIITQSAVVAPMIAISLNHCVGRASSEPPSIFDLGRLLDVARPETIEKFPSLSWVLETGLIETLAEYIRLEEPSGVDSRSLCNVAQERFPS